MTSSSVLFGLIMASLGIVAGACALLWLVVEDYLAG